MTNLESLPYGFQYQPKNEGGREKEREREEVVEGEIRSVCEAMYLVTRRVLWRCFYVYQGNKKDLLKHKVTRIPMYSIYR